MSILTVFSPGIAWYEPTDLIEEDEPEHPAEALTVTQAGGWWTANGEMEE